MKQDKKASSIGTKENIKNVIFILKMLFAASPSRIFVDIIISIINEVFYVFFFIYLYQYIYNCIENQATFDKLFFMVLFGCLGHLGLHFLAAWRRYYNSRNDPQINQHFFGSIIKKSSQIELARFEMPDFYDKFTRAIDESINRIYDLLSNISNIISAFAAAVAIMLIIVAVDPVLLVFSVIPLLFSFFLGNLTNKLIYARDMEMTNPNREKEYVKRVLYEKKYAGEIRIFNIKNLLFQKYERSYKKIYDIDKKYNWKIALLNFINRILISLVVFFGSIIYIVFKCLSGVVSVASYIAMINAVNSMSGNIQHMIYEFIRFKKQGLYIRNLKEFMEYKPAINNNGSNKIDNNFKSLILNDVSFTYNGANKPVISNISFKIKKGEKIALVGHNGAGKTTLVKLIMRLYDVSTGSICLNNQDIRDFDIDQYHNIFSTVFQDFQIFALPIAENVLMRTPKTDKERQIVVSALNKAQFTNKLKKLKNGINTVFTKEFDDQGVVLSGGESQKIAIARVFAKDGEVVILDEPSSALDPISEYNMYKNMMKAAKNKTVIFISHRLSSARLADRIYLLDNGRIAETGSHNQLIELNGKYAEMFKIQAQNYIDEEEVAEFECG